MSDHTQILSLASMLRFGTNLLRSKYGKTVLPMKNFPSKIKLSLKEKSQFSQFLSLLLVITVKTGLRLLHRQQKVVLYQRYKCIEM